MKLKAHDDAVFRGVLQHRDWVRVVFIHAAFCHVWESTMDELAEFYLPDEINGLLKARAFYDWDDSIFEDDLEDEEEA